MNLRQIKKLSPVPVTYKYSLIGSGEYDILSNCINIDKDLSNNRKMECLIHEIGHAVHHVNNCKCMQDYNNHALAEYHAARFTMKYIQNNPVLIRIFVGVIFKELDSEPSAHRIAAKRITKLKQWAKFCKV